MYDNNFYCCLFGDFSSCAACYHHFIDAMFPNDDGTYRTDSPNKCNISTSSELLSIGLKLCDEGINYGQVTISCYDSQSSFFDKHCSKIRMAEFYDNSYYTFMVSVNELRQLVIESSSSITIDRYMHDSATPTIENMICYDDVLKTIFQYLTPISKEDMLKKFDEIDRKINYYYSNGWICEKTKNLLLHRNKDAFRLHHDGHITYNDTTFYKMI